MLLTLMAFGFSYVFLSDIERRICEQMIIIENEDDLKKALKSQKRNNMRKKPITVLTNDYIVKLNRGIGHRIQEKEACYAASEELAAKARFR